MVTPPPTRLDLAFTLQLLDDCLEANNPLWRDFLEGSLAENPARLPSKKSSQRWLLASSQSSSNCNAYARSLLVGGGGSWGNPSLNIGAGSYPTTAERGSGGGGVTDRTRRGGAAGGVTGADMDVRFWQGQRLEPNV